MDLPLQSGDNIWLRVAPSVLTDCQPYFGEAPMLYLFKSTIFDWLEQALGLDRRHRLPGATLLRTERIHVQCSTYLNKSNNAYPNRIRSTWSAFIVLSESFLYWFTTNRLSRATK